MQSIGREASEDIQDKFDQLSDDVNSKQDELIDSLAQQYNDSLSEVDARIEEMQAANRGLIDMAFDAINGVIETIRQLKQLISDLLSEIQLSLAIIMADPIGFVSNLFAGVKQGFDNFKANIETHLIAGFVQWLTGALGPIGITIPENLFSLKGVFSLVMQVLGLTWDYMRQKAVKLLGEPVVRAMEFGLEMFQIIREKGVEGIWEYIKEQFTDLKETIIDSIKNMLITQVIQAGIRWLLSLLIPGAGFIKAIMAIKDFIVFFVESAIMLIPALIEAIRAMASGSMTLVATAIERGLGLLMPLVIKLFARIIGLGGLVKKVQKIIKKIRRRIDRAINKLILKAKKAFRKLMRRLIGGPDTRTPQEKEQDLRLAVREGNVIMDREDITPDEVREQLPALKTKYRLEKIELIKNPNNDKYHIYVKINPETESQEKKLKLRENVTTSPIPLQVGDPIRDKNQMIGYKISELDVTVTVSSGEVTGDVTGFKVNNSRGGTTFFPYYQYNDGWDKPDKPAYAVCTVNPSTPTANRTSQVIIDKENINKGTRANISASKHTEAGYDTSGKWARAGHLVAKSLGGPGGYSRGNIVAMTIEANHTTAGMRGVEDAVLRDINMVDAVYDYSVSPVYGSNQIPPETIIVNVSRLYPDNTLPSTVSGANKTINNK